MNQAAFSRTGHSDHVAKGWQVGPGNVSFAEWRFETRAGHRAFGLGDYEKAAAHFAVAVMIAQRLAAVASLGGADPGCAVRALIAARRNVAENCLCLGLTEEADNALEMTFLQLCAVAKSPGSPLQDACACQVSTAAATLMAQLKNKFTSPARLLAIQSIADETLDYVQSMEPAR